MRVETKIKLNKFVPRIYQRPLFEAFDDVSNKIKRYMCVWPRRSGKDICAYNLCIRELLKKPQTIFYVLPTFSSGRRILWDALDNDGKRILDYYLPKELVESKNEQLMRIKLNNGSVFQIIGSDQYDTTLIGTNPRGVVFSEFAISNPMAYSLVRPILSANAGWLLIISTPRGRTFMYDMYEVARNTPENWFVSKLTLEDTCHIPLDEVEKERLSGEMSEDLQAQEYYTSFSLGIEGSFYCKIIDKLRLEGHIGDVPWEPYHPVFTAWDIGLDTTAIIFFQVIGSTIHFIDYFEAANKPLDYCIGIIKSKDYKYGRHFGPHDMANREYTSGVNRLDFARGLGVEFELAPNISREDGIECVRANLPRTWIDKTKCSRLVKVLETYRQEYDEKRKIYSGKPFHDEFSHGCDAARYLYLSLNRCSPSTSPEELEKRYREAMYGSSEQMPKFFR